MNDHAKNKAKRAKRLQDRKRYDVTNCTGDVLKTVHSSSEARAVRKAGFDPDAVCEGCYDYAFRARLAA